MIDKNNITHTNRAKKLSIKAIISFLLAFITCLFFVGSIALHRSSIEELNMEKYISDKSAKINEVISKLIHKTQGLSALVVQSDGKMEDFTKVAATIVDDDAIINILIAPSGIVSDIYPLQGNETLIGYNLLGEGDGNKEAILAKETGQLVFGGPFELVQGGQAFVGRLPVFLESSNGNKEFWGLVSVTLKYPQVLDGAELDVIENQGLAYEVWRISPDTNEKQILFKSGNYCNLNTHYIEKHISIQNADWYFRIYKARAWYEHIETWVMIFIGLCVSFLIAIIVQSNYKLRLMQSELETTANIDSLTGIFNRRYFMEHASIQIEKSLRTGSNCFIILYDVDFFKDINDTHGHLAGDRVLRRIAQGTKNVVRPYDLFARYGGEEFILLVPDADRASVINIAERIRLLICEKPIECDSLEISVSASFGCAQVMPDSNLEKTIALADAALYRAKKNGRNRVVLDDNIN